MVKIDPYFWSIQTICSNTAQVTCVEELDQDDCPDGFYLQDNMMLGCCPACVRNDEFNIDDEIQLH